MRNFIPMLKLDKANDKGASGGANPPAKPAAEQPPTTPPAAPETAGASAEDFGYETPAAAEAPPKAGEKSKEGDPPPQAPPEKPEEVVDPGTGYGKEPPKVDDPPAPPPAAPPAAPDDMDKALEGLPKEDVPKLKEFMTKNGLTVAQAKAFADARKSEIEANDIAAKNMQKQFEQEKLRTRAQWHKELKDDPAFGGEKFDLSISRAEKVLAECLPGTKKVLTETKSMLPPYVMRDLAKLWDRLYATEKLPQGEPPVPAKQETEIDDGLDFYT